MVEVQSLSPSKHSNNSHEHHAVTLQKSAVSPAASSPSKLPLLNHPSSIAQHQTPRPLKNPSQQNEEELLFQDSAHEVSAHKRPSPSSPKTSPFKGMEQDSTLNIHTQNQHEDTLHADIQVAKTIETPVHQPVHHPVTSGKKLPLIIPPAQRKTRRKSSRPSTALSATNADPNLEPEAASTMVASASSAHSGNLAFDVDIDMDDDETHYNLLQRLGISFDHDQDNEPETSPMKAAESVEEKVAPFPYPPQTEDDFTREKEACLSILSLLFQHDSSYSFQFPVDPIALGLPDYHQVVTRPMDLTTVKSKIESMEFIPPLSNSALPHFMDHSPLDVLIDGTGQTLQNCYRYNPKGNPIRKDAWFLIAYFDSLLQSHSTGRKVNWRRFWGFDDFRPYEKIINDKRRGPNRKSGRPSKGKAVLASNSNSMTRNISLSSLPSDSHNVVSEHQASLSSLYGGEHSNMNTHTQGSYAHKKRRLNANAILHSFPSASSSLLYSILGNSHKSN